MRALAGGRMSGHRVWAQVIWLLVGPAAGVASCREWGTGAGWLVYFVAFMIGGLVANAAPPPQKRRRRSARKSKTEPTPQPTATAEKPKCVDEHGREIVAVKYSAFVDEDCCRACRALDGKEFDPYSPEHLAHEVPYAKCKSREGCRCLLIPVYEKTGDAWPE